MKFNVGDILTNKKREEYHDKIEIHYVIVDTDDTYTYVKRIDALEGLRPARSIPTVNMDWFFNIVSRAE